MPREYKGGREAAQKRYREKNREKRNAQKKEHYQANKERIRAEHGEYRKNNPEKMRESNRAWRSIFWPQLRADFINAYGGKCACCGESEPLFLDLDHIKNNGAEHRKEFGNNQQIILWLKRNGWPRDEYQLLCCNCNQGKARNGGICPHKKKDQY